MAMGNHVLIYCPSFYPDQTGYAHAFAGLIKNVLAAGIRVDLLTRQLNNTNEEFFEHPLLNIYRTDPGVKIWAAGFFYKYFALARFIMKLNDQRNYDAVFIESGDEPLLISLLSETVLMKTVVRFHSTSDTEYLFEGKHFKYKLRYYLWKFLAAGRICNICATNTYHLNYAKRYVAGVNNYRYSGVIINTADKVTEAIAEEGNISKTFVMLGRMDDEGYKQKGFDVLLKALPQVSGKFEKSGSSIVVIGNGNRYEAFASESSLYPIVQLHKSLPHQQILELLNRADVVLLPSLYEGASMFALEAIGLGKAVIFSNTGGLTDMVSGNGFLVEPGNHTALAEAISKMINTNQLSKMKAASVSLAKERFDAHTQVSQFKQMIATIKS